MGLPKQVVIIKGERDICVRVGLTEVMWGNYDEHGWTGMQAIEDTAAAVGRAIGAEVTVKHK